MALQVLERVVDSDTGEITWSDADTADLNRLEDAIQDGALQMWRALRDLRDRRLYRRDFPSFEAYLRERWDISRSRGYQITAAADLVDAVAGSGVTIPNERVARSLLAVNPDRRLPVLLSAHSASGGRLTSGYIKSADKVVQDIQTTGHVDVGDGEMRAVDAAINLEEYERLHRQQAYNTAAADKANGVTPDDVKIVLKGAKVHYVGQGLVALTVALDVSAALKAGMVVGGVIIIKAVQA